MLDKCHRLGCGRCNGCAPYVKSTWLRRSTSSIVRRPYLALHQYSTYSMAVKGAEHLRAALATFR